MSYETLASKHAAYEIALIGGFGLWVLLAVKPNWGL
jgi:hypothetical protein